MTVLAVLPFSSKDSAEEDLVPEAEEDAEPSEEEQAVVVSKSAAASAKAVILLDNFISITPLVILNYR
jgi:hypothetical protein